MIMDISGNLATAEVGVFWDIDDCEVPDGLSAGGVLQNIRSIISGKGHRGPVSIRVYGDTTDHVFPSDDIKLNHFPAGERFARQTKIMEELVSWAAEHPEPSTVLLCMGDASDDFVELVTLLKDKKGYQFLYVYPPPQPQPW